MLDFVVPRGGRCAAGRMLAPLRPPADPRVAVIDLREAVWVEPVGLVGVAAFGEAQRRLGRRLRLIGPRDWNVANYLSRMHLGRVVEDLGGEHDLNPVRARELGDILELRRFDGEDGATALAALAYDRTANLEPVARALHQSICEIGANVPEHSGLPGGYMAASSTRDRSQFEFAVGDGGEGLTARLAAVGSVSDEQSLEMVLEQGVTSTGEPGRGRGIQETRHLVTGLRGSVHMVSGLAARSAYRTTSATWSGRSAFPGTLLQGTLRCP